MRKNKATQVSTIQEPPVSDPARAEFTPPEAKERRNGGGSDDPNGQEPGNDKVYGIASRDRWAGSDSASLAELHSDSRKIDAGEGSEEEEEEEEEEETSASDLTVAELKAALDEAKVEYETGAKKADLVALYEANIG